MATVAHDMVAESLTGAVQSCQKLVAGLSDSSDRSARIGQ